MLRQATHLHSEVFILHGQVVDLLLSSHTLVPRLLQLSVCLAHIALQLGDTILFHVATTAATVHGRACGARFALHKRNVP